MTYFQALPTSERPADVDDPFWVHYWKDETGQHAMVLQAPHDGERWHYALIYDQTNRRIKALKYSMGSYQS